ncbi:Rha family transcriptional regulator, partial [Aeromonas veronii bv. sobria]
MNKHEINAYKQALEKYNPFHGVNFPITSVQLCGIINGLREKYNEKVVKLEHYDLMKKVDSFSAGNFSVAESEYLDDQKKPRKCYLLDKRECRIIAATESKAITVLLIDYLEQLEAIFEKAQEAKAN